MRPVPRVSRRWAVPIGALAAIFGVGAVVNLVPAGADAPNLPPLTPAQLLAKVRTAQVDGLSGTVALTSNLGLPSTSGLSTSLAGSSNITLATLLSGTHSADVAVDGPDHLRVTTVKPLAETNWVRNGNDVWTYDSASLKATHLTLQSPEAAGGSSKDPKQAQGGDSGAALGTPDANPAQFAQHLLDQVTPSTDLRVDTPVYVDGRPAYELVLSPKLPASTVQDAVISVDGATGVPLAVRIDGKSGSNPAFSFGFTKIRFARPAPSTFVFKAPPGATVVQASSTAELLNPTQSGPRRLHRRLPGGNSRLAGPRVLPPRPLTPPAGAMPAAALPQQVTTIGQDWSTVAILAGRTMPPQIAALFRSAPAITVGSHQGRLVTSKLLTAIFLDDGRVAVGALSPGALAAAVAAG